MLATAQGNNFVEHTDNEQGHIAAREKKSSKPLFSILLNGSLDTPVEVCKNSAPSSCDKITGMCHGFQEAGLCKTEWKHFSHPNMCSENTPGRIKDYCQVECGVCKRGFEYS